MIIKVLSLSFLFSVIYAEVTRASIKSALKESISIPKYSGDPSQIIDGIRITSKELKHLKFNLAQIDEKISQYNLKQDIIDQIKKCDCPRFITTMTNEPMGRTLHLDGGYKLNGILHYFQGILSVKGDYFYRFCDIENVVCLIGLNYKNSSMDYSYIYHEYSSSKSRHNKYIEEFFFEEMVKLMDESNPEECPEYDYREIYPAYVRRPSKKCCVIKGPGKCPPTKEKFNLVVNITGVYGMKRIEQEFFPQIASEFKDDDDDDDDDDDY